MVAELIMDELAPLVRAQFGAFYLADDTTERPELRLISSYGSPEDSAPRLAFGQEGSN